MYFNIMFNLSIRKKKILNAFNIKRKKKKLMQQKKKTNTFRGYCKEL